jgi:hypothetical protein
MPVKYPYWIVKSRAFLLDIPFFGDKSQIQQNIENLLFQMPPNDMGVSRTIPSSEECKLKGKIDLYEKRFGKTDASSVAGKI